MPHKTHNALTQLEDLYGSNFVLGEGPVPCDLFLLGEAPGREEDKALRPFVGRSGKLLDKLLQEVGIRRNSVRITNAVKQRPPQNRAPVWEEIRSHRRCLVGEVQRCAPKAILAMGKTAARAALDMEFVESISVLRKKVVFWNALMQTRVFITYHPAAALRDVNYKKLLKQDLQRSVRWCKTSN